MASNGTPTDGASRERAAEASVSHASPATRGGRPRSVPWALFAGSLLLYLLNGYVLPVNDSLPNLYMPVSLLTWGTPTVEPLAFPSLFFWGLLRPEGEQSVLILDWRQKIGPFSAGELYRQGVLVPRSPMYSFVQTTSPGRCVGIYGPGAGLFALPVYASIALFVDHLDERRWWIFYGGKFAAAALAAGSVVFVYLASLLLASRTSSVLVALTYGAGTCLWSEGSQALWQQTAALFFVAWGALLLLRGIGDCRAGFLCGLVIGTAAFCRPTCLLLLMAAFLSIATSRRKMLPRNRRGPPGSRWRRKTRISSRS